MIKPEIDSNGYQMHYISLFIDSLEQLARFLIRYPEKLEEFKDLEIYDKIKDVDWESACYAYYDTEEKCLVIQYPRIATIEK